MKFRINKKIIKMEKFALCAVAVGQINENCEIMISIFSNSKKFIVKVSNNTIYNYHNEWYKSDKCCTELFEIVKWLHLNGKTIEPYYEGGYMLYKTCLTTKKNNILYKFYDNNPFEENYNYNIAELNFNDDNIDSIKSHFINNGIYMGNIFY